MTRGLDTETGRGHTRRVMRAAAALVALGLVAAACSGGDDDDGGQGGGAAEAAATTVVPADTVYPGADWERSDAAEMGFDPAALEAIAGTAEAANSSCLVVTRKGEIVGEWYWDGADAETPREVFSVTKSISSTLVGLAEADGDLKITDPASDYIPEWEGTDSADVTVQNLVSNDSGREWSLALDYGDLIRAPDHTAFAVGLGQDAEPGTTWAYNNSAIQTLDEVLHTATGERPADYAASKLFEPIGMANSEMTVDGAGSTLTFMGLHTTCEDLARFGYLFLRHGSWDGTQVVPEAWVEAATGDSSQDLNAAYGYLWWLNRKGPLGSPTQAVDGQAGGDQADGQMVPGAPEDMFWALGLQNQIVAVDPGSETVVVRIGGTPDAGQPAFTQADTAKVVTEALTSTE
jgi:CubicO group peptidase (beta-lactamase class C family)